MTDGWIGLQCGERGVVGTTVALGKGDGDGVARGVRVGRGVTGVALSDRASPASEVAGDSSLNIPVSRSAWGTSGRYLAGYA